MTDYAAAPDVAQRVRIDANDVLKRAWQLYKRLFARSLVIGGLVFGTLHFIEAVGRSRHSAGLNLLSLVLVFAGTALVQGGLVEIVRGLHADGDDDASVGEALGRAAGSRSSSASRSSAPSSSGSASWCSSCPAAS
jgi:hypothetical protein